MHAKYKVSITYGSKVIASFKSWQKTNGQTGQKQYDPIFQSGGIKIYDVKTLQVNQVILTKHNAKKDNSN